MMLSSKVRSILFQVIGALLMITLPMLIYPKPDNIGLFEPTHPAIKNLISNILMAIFFYANYYLLLPSLFLKKRYVAYGSTILVALAIIIMIPDNLVNIMPHWEDRPPMPPMGDMKPQPRRSPDSNFFMMTSHNLLLFISIVLLSVLLKVREQWYATEREKNIMELSSLKEKINPHFLFNTLNSIYAMSFKEDAPATGSALLKLSNMMRYVIGETKEQFVLLNKELAYLDNYIELQRERLDTATTLKYSKTENIDPGLLIAPLILIPFIENAFKHGVNPDISSQIDIEILCEDKTLKMTVTNQKVNTILAHHEQSGKGIATTKARLDLLYPKKHQLSLIDKPDSYKAYLELKLHVKSHSDRR